MDESDKLFLGFVAIVFVSLLAGTAIDKFSPDKKCPQVVCIQGYTMKQVGPGVFRCVPKAER